MQRAASERVLRRGGSAKMSKWKPDARHAHSLKIKAKLRPGTSAKAATGGAMASKRRGLPMPSILGTGSMRVAATGDNDAGGDGDAEGVGDGSGCGGSSEGQRLFTAVSAGQTGRVQALFEACGSAADATALANWKHASGCHVLHRAAVKGHTEVVETLFARGALVEATDKGGWRALHRAARFGHTGVVRALLAAGAEVDAQTGSDGRRALHLAAGYGHCEVVLALLDAGADIDAHDGSGCSPLKRAQDEMRSTVAELLKDRGARAPHPCACAIQ